MKSNFPKTIFAVAILLSSNSALARGSFGRAAGHIRSSRNNHHDDYSTESHLSNTDVLVGIAFAFLIIWLVYFLLFRKSSIPRR